MTTPDSGFDIPEDPPHQESSREIAVRFLQSNPEAVDDIWKATFAFHLNHPREHPKAHQFNGPHRGSLCGWCSRSREDVRYDALPAECQRRPAEVFPDIKETILGEEKKALSLLARANKDVPAIIAKSGMDLCLLHDTHGFDPDTVELVLGHPLPPEAMEAYQESREALQRQSREAFIPKIISL